MHDFAAAPDSVRDIWLTPSIWTDALDAIDSLDIPSIDIISACMDALASGDDPLRPTEMGAFRSMVAVSVSQRRTLVRLMLVVEQEHIAELERGIVTPLHLKRIARGEPPLWVADTQRGRRVWVRTIGE